MIIKPKFKLILSSLAIGSTIPFSLMTSTIVNQNKTNQFIDQFTLLEDDILNNRNFIGTSETIKYDNQIFNNQEELNGYLLSNNIIQKKLTSSDPGKIIADYGTGKLKENLIYDTNMDNFSRVYRNRSGDVSLTEQEAIKSYENYVRLKFSYDGYNWADTENGAEVNEKDKLNIKKSLYYDIDGQYYNAFNNDDANSLVSRMQPGYFIKKTNHLNGSPLSDKEENEIYGTKSDLYNKLKNNLKRYDWPSYYGKAINSVSTPVLTVHPRKNYKLTFRHLSNNNIADSVVEEEYENGMSPLKIELYNKQFNNQSEFNQWWKTGWIYDECWGYNLLGKHIKTRAILTKGVDWINNKGERSPGAIILTPRKWTTNLNPSSNYDTTFSSEGFFELFANAEDKQESIKTGSKNKVIGKTSSRSGIWSTDDINTYEDGFLFDRWYENYFATVISDFGEEDNNRYLTFDDIKNDNLIENKKEHSNKIGRIYKDLFYAVNGSKGYDYSMLITYNEWKEKRKELENTKIFNSEINEYEYSLRPNLYVSEKYLDNYLYLNEKITSKVMYSSSPSIDSSDRNGIFLANTEKEAKEKAFINSGDFLIVKYIIVGAYGEEVESLISEEDALRLLANKIKFSSKFVNKKEINSWHTEFKDVSWDSIISNGIYEVYYIDNPIDSSSSIYFSTKQQAINALKLNSYKFNTNNYQSEIKNHFVYNYRASNGQYLSFNFFDNDYNYIIKKIINFENQLQ